MTRSQAKLFWKSLSPQQQADFNAMMQKLGKKELMLSYVGVDVNENIQTIVLDPKDKTPKPDKPFYDHFHLGKDE